MTTIVHETPGHIDVRALTVLGVNAKPNSGNPIGYFGTGLKYAIATLCRLGADVTVWIGAEPHVFFVRPMQFRGSTFHQLYLKRTRGVTRRWFTTELPFTTEFGKNWECWMALRELHSNTLDENGSSYAVDAGGAESKRAGHPDATDSDEGVERHAGEIRGRDGLTRIAVRLPAYADAFSRLDEVFHPLANAPAALHGVQILPGPSRHLYYRGLRAKDLVKPARRVWIFWTALTLTEDRTLREEFYAKWSAAIAVRQSRDAPMIREVLQAAEGDWEHDLDFKNTAALAPASEEFTEMATLYGRRDLRDFINRKRDPATRPSIAWQREIILAMDEEPGELGDVAWRHKVALRSLLERDLARTEREVTAASLAATYEAPIVPF